MSALPRHIPGGSGKRSLPMVWPFTIGKAFGLAAATRPRNSYEARTYGKKTGPVRHNGCPDRLSV
jgi:hypothetical protein